MAERTSDTFPPSPCPLPEDGVYRNRGHVSGGCIEKRTVMPEFAVAKKPGEHRQSAESECLVDEGLLTVQRLDGGATRQRVFPRFHVDDLRVEFADGSQALGLPVVPCIQRLTKDVLAA